METILFILAFIIAFAIANLFKGSSDPFRNYDED